MANFTWTDLSTFDTKKTKLFYEKLFDWNFFDESGYEIAYENTRAIAAIYEMPQKFQKINMPSFWMSYIRVENLDLVVAAAKTVAGTIVEIEPTEFGEGRISLVRDPSGAGFTLYEGPDLTGRFESGHGKPTWNILYVNDLDLVKIFYETVLGWKIELLESDVYGLFDESGAMVAHIEIWPDEIKGKEQYWIPVFLVDDLLVAAQIITSLGGDVIWKQSDTQYMAHDPQGGGFIIKLNT